MAYAARHLLASRPAAVAGPGPPVAGYKAWYDASQITGQADGSALATWPDLSGNGNTLTQATPASRPTYYSTTPGKLINGKPTVWFNGAQVLASAPVNVALGPMSVLAVCENADYSNYHGLFSHADAGTLGAPFEFYFGASTGIPVFQNGGSPAQASANPGLAAHMIEYLWDGTAGAGSVLHFTDGTANGTAATSTAAGGSYPFTLGDRNGGGTPLLGLVAEVVYYQSLLSTVNRQSVENYLRTKWGTP